MSIPAFVWSFLVVAVCSLLSGCTPLWTDFELSSISNMNDTSSKPLNIDVHTNRVRKGVYGISGTVTVTDDLSGYTGEVVMYHSAARNNDYKLVPFKVPEGPLCDKTNKEYRQYLMKDLHPMSDLPYSDDDKVDMCSLFEIGKSFEVKNYEFNKDNIPKFLQTGRYRAHILLKKDGVLLSGLEALVDLL